MSYRAEPSIEATYGLDTDVLVAAFPSDAGASFWLLEAVRGRRFKLLLSVLPMLEQEAALLAQNTWLRAGLVQKTYLRFWTNWLW